MVLHHAELIDQDPVVLELADIQSWLKRGQERVFLLELHCFLLAQIFGLDYLDAESFDVRVFNSDYFVLGEVFDRLGVVNNSVDFISEIMNLSVEDSPLLYPSALPLKCIS